MNRKIFLLTLMSVSLCLTPCVAYAAQGETDMYGNPIDWDENGIGNEDDDGSDDTFSEDSLIIPDNEEKSSAPSDETSGGHESQTDIYETTAPREEAHSTDSVKVGTVIVKFSVPDNWGRDDIILGLYNKTEGEKYDISLYHDQGYKSEALLPVGAYEVRGANISGDQINAQPIYSDTSDFELQEDDPQYISLRPVQLEVSDESSIEETHTDDANDARSDFSVHKMLLSLLIGIGIVGGSGIIAFRYFTHKKE